MIAALPMYDHPAARDGNDALWSLLRDALRQCGAPAPDHLTREPDYVAGWQSPDLVLGQTCGLPYRLWLHGEVTLLGAFDYGLADTPRGYYHSVFVVRTADARQTTEAFGDAPLAYNAAHSQSGWAAAWAEGLGQGSTLLTGGHAASALAVRDGQADIAAIDAVTWRFLERDQPDLAQALRVIGRSRPVPGLPLITAFPEWAASLSEVLSEVAPPPETGILGFVPLAPEAYLAVSNPPSPTGTPP